MAYSKTCHQPNAQYNFMLLRRAELNTQQGASWACSGTCVAKRHVGVHSGAGKMAPIGGLLQKPKEKHADIADLRALPHEGGGGGM